MWWAAAREQQWKTLAKYRAKYCTFAALVLFNTLQHNLGNQSSTLGIKEFASLDLGMHRSVTASPISWSSILSDSLSYGASGHLPTLRLLLGLMKRLSPAPLQVTPNSGTVGGLHYGNHMAISMALGFLFCGGGHRTFRTDNLAVASLLISLFPKFPQNPMDQRCHLQVRSMQTHTASCPHFYSFLHLVLCQSFYSFGQWRAWHLLLYIVVLLIFVIWPAM